MSRKQKRCIDRVNVPCDACEWVVHLAPALQHVGVIRMDESCHTAAIMKETCPACKPVMSRTWHKSQPIWCAVLWRCIASCPWVGDAYVNESWCTRVWMCRTGWRRPIGCLKLQVNFRKRAIQYRALLREMTYKDKASYGSSPPCITHEKEQYWSHKWVMLHSWMSHVTNENGSCHTYRESWVLTYACAQESYHNSERAVLMCESVC